MGQLHDRNCRRAFAPAEAFQADALPAERFQSEVQVRAAGNGCLQHGAAGQYCGSGPCMQVGWCVAQTTCWVYRPSAALTTASPQPAGCDCGGAGAG